MCHVITFHVYVNHYFIYHEYWKSALYAVLSLIILIRIHIIIKRVIIRDKIRVF